MGGNSWLLNPIPKNQKPAHPIRDYIWSCFIDQIEDQENNAEQNNDPQIVDNETKPNNEDLNEALRTAKKIEKASVSGLVRQVSLPSLHCYLPPGWHCRKTSEDEGLVYFNN